MADVTRNGEEFTVDASIIADGLGLPEHAIARGQHDQQIVLLGKPLHALFHQLPGVGSGHAAIPK